MYINSPKPYEGVEKEIQLTWTSLGVDVRPRMKGQLAENLRGSWRINPTHLKANSPKTYEGVEGYKTLDERPTRWNLMREFEKEFTGSWKL